MYRMTFPTHDHPPRGGVKEGPQCVALMGDSHRCNVLGPPDQSTSDATDHPGDQFPIWTGYGRPGGVRPELITYFRSALYLPDHLLLIYLSSYLFFCLF